MKSEGKNEEFEKKKSKGTIKKFELYGWLYKRRLPLAFQPYRSAVAVAYAENCDDGGINTSADDVHLPVVGVGRLDVIRLFHLTCKWVMSNL